MRVNDRESSVSSCLGKTCLKWQPNGELSAVDLQAVLLRLHEADHRSGALLVCELPGGQRAS